MSQSIKKEVESFLEWSKELYGPIYFAPSETPAVKKKAEVPPSEPFIASSAPAPSSVHPLTLSSVTTLEELRQLCATAEELKTDLPGTNLVFGVGNPNADLMLVGEAPGENEDQQGEPFVGKAGQLLTDILKAIKFRREDVYIANILKHRPPNNRDPLPEERERSLPYLMKQIDIVNPKLILCVGKVAGSTLLGLDLKTQLADMRGHFHPLKENHEVMVTFHPAALLRNPKWKKDVWADVQLLRKRYVELGCEP